MLRKLMIIGALVSFGNCAVMAGECNCKAVTEAKSGFCDSCNKGQIFGEKLTSRKLYEALHGHSVESAKMTCEGCKRASEKNGKCASCKIGFAHGRMYHSPMGHSMAVGESYSAEKSNGCSGCKKAFAKHGFCSGCNVGFVRGLIYRSRSQHHAAARAHEIIHDAITLSKKCEDCALAMVTNSKCEKCNIRFQNGRSISKRDHKGDERVQKKKPSNDDD